MNRSVSCLIGLLLMSSLGAGPVQAQTPTVVGGSMAISCTATGSTATALRRVAAPIGGATTDSAGVIQKAIDVASRKGGGTVQLAAGTYMVSRPLIVRSGVTLKGAGSSTRVKAGPLFLKNRGPFGGHPLITTNGATKVTISDLVADQSGDTLNGNTTRRLNEYLIDVRYTDDALVQRVTTVNPFTYSIAVVASTNFCVQNNFTSVSTSGKYNQLDGIHIFDSSFGVVQRNTVDQGSGSDGDDGLVAHSIGEPVHDVAYLNNKVRGGRHGSAMQIAAGAAGAYNLTINGNVFWGSPKGLVTGYYGARGAVKNVQVRDNAFRDNAGRSVDFFGAVSQVVLTGNTACRSGSFNVTAGAGNRIDGRGAC